MTLTKSWPLKYTSIMDPFTSVSLKNSFNIYKHDLTKIQINVLNLKQSCHSWTKTCNSLVFPSNKFMLKSPKIISIYGYWHIQLTNYRTTFYVMHVSCNVATVWCDDQKSMLSLKTLCMMLLPSFHGI